MNPQPFLEEAKKKKARKNRTGKKKESKKQVCRLKSQYVGNYIKYK